MQACEGSLRTLTRFCSSGYSGVRRLKAVFQKICGEKYAFFALFFTIQTAV